jgi:hypothetical protein
MPQPLYPGGNEALVLIKTFVVRPLNPNVDASDRSYLNFKCPCMQLGTTAISLSAMNVYIYQDRGVPFDR